MKISISNIYLIIIILALCLIDIDAVEAQKHKFKILSHPPIRTIPLPSQRPLAGGPSYFVDPLKGSNNNDGSKRSPWQTINHALKQLSPGATLYLRQGTYFENVYCAVAGSPDKPVTIRSYPGELAIIDGGIPEFQQQPEKAWIPYSEGVEDEFISAGTYKNIRDVVGLFGDSHIGLNSYWHVQDLRSDNEFWLKVKDNTDREVAWIYCGPGLWYDRLTGHIHVRLSHTHLKPSPPQMVNYKGETDPRNIPLVIAPFNSVPLFVDGAKHVRFQDLVIRGGGYNNVVLQTAEHVELEKVIIFAGTYGMRARGTGPLSFKHSAIYGMFAPWCWRNENCLRSKDGEPFTADAVYAPGENRQKSGKRNIARLVTHACLVNEGSFEFELPFPSLNHDWEIAYCEFTDGHDGVYPNGRNMRFHHNWVDNHNDDGVYFSSPLSGVRPTVWAQSAALEKTARPLYTENLRIYQNLITRCFMAFGSHHKGHQKGTVYIYRNIIDLRQGVNFRRPMSKDSHGDIYTGHVHLSHHGARNIESLYYYQNTFVAPAREHSYSSVIKHSFAHSALKYVRPNSLRRSLNNICIYLNSYPPTGNIVAETLKEADVWLDGNLHWCPQPDEKIPENYLEQARRRPGWSKNSIVGAPKFIKFSMDAAVTCDYLLSKESPAIGKGVEIPSEWEDPLQQEEGKRPDIGALPFGSKPLRVGIDQRITAGIARSRD